MRVFGENWLIFYQLLVIDEVVLTRIVQLIHDETERIVFNQNVNSVLKL